MPPSMQGVRQTMKHSDEGNGEALRHMEAKGHDLTHPRIVEICSRIPLRGRIRRNRALQTGREDLWSLDRVVHQ